MSSNQKQVAEKLIASNPAARSNYTIEETVEAGMVLTGTEVKSLRNQSPNIRDAYVDVQPFRGGFEAWLVNVHIGPYSHGNIWNHDALRRRKLLLHQHQLEKLYGAVLKKGVTIVPLRMYFKNGRAKIELGLGKGKKQYDKRETIKRKTAEREMEIAIKKGI